jgi:anti-sigma-K factor RskA
MSVHEQFAEDLALYALGSLPAAEQAAVMEHLESCRECRDELDHLHGDMALLALSAGGPRPPQRARQRLITTVAREPRFKPAPRRNLWWAIVPSLAAVGLAVLVAGLWLQNGDLKRQLLSLLDLSTQQQAQLQQAKAVVETLTASDALRVTLVAAKSPPQPQGKAIYMRNRASLIFMASNLPAAPPQKAYELWLIPAKGAPIPAGVFKPDAHGNANVINPPLPPDTEAKAFAITVEPEAGSSTPTMPIMMMGAGD